MSLQAFKMEYFISKSIWFSFTSGNWETFSAILANKALDFILIYFMDLNHELVAKAAGDDFFSEIAQNLCGSVITVERSPSLYLI